VATVQSGSCWWAKDFPGPDLFHTLSLAAFSPGWGWARTVVVQLLRPREAFKNLGDHNTSPSSRPGDRADVLIISAAYTRSSSIFPSGAAGNIVTSRLIGPRAGVVSGAALLIDYVLTCTTSVAAGGEAIFSNFPQDWHVWKLPVELVAMATSRC